MHSAHKLYPGKDLVDEERKRADDSNLLIVVRLKWTMKNWRTDMAGWLSSGKASKIQCG